MDKLNLLVEFIVYLAPIVSKIIIPVALCFVSNKKIKATLVTIKAVIDLL